MQRKDSSNGKSSIPSCTTWQQFYGTHLPFFLLVPVIVLLTLAGREKTSSMLATTTLLQAYEGDAIFVGRSKLLDTVWTIQQSPRFGDAYHTISFFLVPESKARQNTFPFRVENVTSESFVINETSNSVGVRRYVYLLPRSRLPMGEVAKVKYKFNITSLSTYEPLNGLMFIFKQREHLSDFEDCEPGAELKAVHCSCLSSQSGSVGCPKACSATPDFSPGEWDDEDSLYYFFATQVPGNARVEYSVRMTMYFYNITAFSKGFICTIRGTDSCEIPVPAYNPFTPWRERMVVVAYIHPSTLSVPPTSHLRIDKEGDVWKTAVLGVCVTTLGYLAIRLVYIVISKQCRGK